MATYFSDASFKFLRGLARHNDKTWFNAHKAQYEDHVRQPFLRPNHKPHRQKKGWHRKT